MKKEELENRLKISEKTCIHCPTLELAKQVLNIFHQLGLKWCTGTHYTICTNWDSNKENTVYHPFNGEFSSLEFAPLISYKIINAEEFIALHTKGEEFDLETYTPKGELEGFPKEIIAKMLDYQVEQGNSRDISVFEKQCAAGCFNKGFTWENTKEGRDFWLEVIIKKNFNLFFEKYPKKQDYQELKNNKNMQENNKKEDNSQEFKVRDKVYDILLKEVGVVQGIDYSPNIPYGLSVEFKSGLKSYTINGCYIPESKNPHLLHYRDDYDYNVIDFNNLPKRQEDKRWRTEKEGEYYFIRFYIEGWFSICAAKDDNSSIDNINYNSGNYFRTEVEAKNIAQKINTYFKQLIQEEHE